MYAYSEHFVLVLSHDEVVHLKCSMLGKMPGDRESKFANLKLAYAYMCGHPGKKLLFMGQEFAQWNEWSEERALDWYLLDDPSHKEMQQFTKKCTITIVICCISIRMSRLCMNWMIHRKVLHGLMPMMWTTVCIRLSASVRMAKKTCCLY